MSEIDTTALNEIAVGIKRIKEGLISLRNEVTTVRECATLTTMNTRELLIEEINQAPEDILQRLLRYLQIELKRRDSVLPLMRPTTSGPYADDWNQFIGVFADEEWERPPQELLEQRAEW